MNINDLGLPVTPSMCQFTIQANAFDTAIELLPKSVLRSKQQFSIFLVQFMENNAHDELGNYSDLDKYATVFFK